jgi:hypothetical protein
MWIFAPDNNAFEDRDNGMWGWMQPSTGFVWFKAARPYVGNNTRTYQEWCVFRLGYVHPGIPPTAPDGNNPESWIHCREQTLEEGFLPF